MENYPMVPRPVESMWPIAKPINKHSQDSSKRLRIRYKMGPKLKYQTMLAQILKMNPVLAVKSISEVAS
jgi:hypothetical protein